MIRDANELIQQLFSTMQRFLEQQNRRAPAQVSQEPAEQLRRPSGRSEPAPATVTAQQTDKLPATRMDEPTQEGISDLIENMVEKLEELGSRIRRLEERVGIKTEFQRQEPGDQAGLPGSTH